MLKFKRSVPAWSNFHSFVRLRPMQAKFMKHEEFSIECSLHNIVPSNKVTFKGNYKNID